MGFLPREFHKFLLTGTFGMPPSEDPVENFGDDIELDDTDVRFYKALREVLTSLFGPNVAAMIFYHIGLKMGEALISYSKRNSLDSRSVIEDFFSKSGLGNLRIRESAAEAYMQREVKLSIKGQGRGIGCYLARGTVQRYYESVFGERVAIIESFCGIEDNLPCHFMRRLNGV